MSLEALADAGFDLETTNHADAILSRAFQAEFDALCEVLLSMEIKCTEMMKGGGNEAPPTRRLRRNTEKAQPIGTSSMNAWNVALAIHAHCCWLASPPRASRW